MKRAILVGFDWISALKCGRPVRNEVKLMKKLSGSALATRLDAGSAVVRPRRKLRKLVGRGGLCHGSPGFICRVSSHPNCSSLF